MRHVTVILYQLTNKNIATTGTVPVLHRPARHVTLLHQLTNKTLQRLAPCQSCIDQRVTLPYYISQILDSDQTAASHRQYNSLQIFLIKNTTADFFFHIVGLVSAQKNHALYPQSNTPVAFYPV